VCRLSAMAPSPKWRGAEAYVHDFSRMQQLPLYPSLLLAPAFVVLLACIHLSGSGEKKVRSLAPVWQKRRRRASRGPTIAS